MLRGAFGWGRGYGAFSVSHSNLDAVVRYIENQEEHHRRKSFAEELSALVKVHGLERHDDETEEAEPEDTSLQ
jgi:putative transposase